MSASARNRIFVGIDTSCYTSSATCVCVDGIIHDERRLLDVPVGERGLRQSDAVFQHTRNLTDLVPGMLEKIDPASVAAIGVSICPSGRENSYMPVFLVGKLVAETLGASLKVPVYGFTHQQGHIRAALHKNEDLLSKPFLAFHLSGGTSELLSVDHALNAERIGGSTDINAGQLVDRIGVKLGLGFPAGKALERLARGASERGVLLKSSVKGLEFSLSGAETRALQAMEAGESAQSIAFSVYDAIARTLAKVVKNAVETVEYASQPFIFAGGVASSELLRELLLSRVDTEKTQIRFALPALSSDNAVGAAYLAMDRYLKQCSE